MSETPEFQIIRKHLSTIAQAIASQPSGPSWFADQLYQEQLTDSRDALPATMTPYEKASELLRIVEHRLNAPYLDSTKEFHKFLKILQRNVAYKEMADHLQKQYSEYKDSASPSPNDRDGSKETDANKATEAHDVPVESDPGSSSAGYGVTKSSDITMERKIPSGKTEDSPSLSPNVSDGSTQTDVNRLATGTHDVPVESDSGSSGASRAVDGVTKSPDDAQENLKSVRPLDDATLSRVADGLGSGAMSFRLGIYLGLYPHQIDSILQGDPNLTPWQRNMQILVKWREKGVAGNERLALAQALRRLGRGRLASEVDPQVTTNPGSSSFINPGNPEFTACEIEEISRDVGMKWEPLGAWLGLSDHTMSGLRHSNEELSVRAFRCLWAWQCMGDSVTRERLASALKRIGKGRLASRIYQPQP